MISYRVVARFLCAALMLSAATVFTQEAPTGAHYAGRPSDTGTGGSAISVAGDFAGMVPLALPPERTGAQIPLQVSYVTHGVGAAGLGWDVPLSFIKRDRTFAHRRPVYAPDSP